MSKLNKILLVDDDETSNFLTELMLKEMDLAQDVIISLNGEEALDYIKNHCETKDQCPELILLDINMPVMDGFEFLEEFEKIKDGYKNKKLNIVMLTSSNYFKDFEKAKKFNVRGYINKPLTEEKIIQILEEK